MDPGATAGLSDQPVVPVGPVPQRAAPIGTGGQAESAVRIDQACVDGLRRAYAESSAELIGLVRRFRERGRRRIEVLGAAVAAGDAAEVGGEAHALCGSSAMIGAIAVSVLSSRLEDEARAGRLPPADALLELAAAFERDVSTVLAQLEQG